MVVCGSGPASVETDNEMWHFWLKGASSGIGMHFRIRNTWFESLLCSFVFGVSEDLGKSVGLLEYKSSPVQSRGDTADPHQVVVRTAMKSCVEHSSWWECMYDRSSGNICHLPFLVFWNLLEAVLPAKVSWCEAGPDDLASGAFSL